MRKFDIYHENKLHSQGLFPFNIYLCSIPHDFKKVGTHWHEQYEIIVVKKGRGFVCVDLSPIEVEEGELIFIRKNKLHSIYMIEEEAMNYETILFEESIIFDAENMESITNYSAKFFDRIEHLPVHIKKDNKEYQNILQTIYSIDNYSEKKCVGYEIMIKAKLIELAFFLMQSKEEKVANIKEEQVLNVARKIIYYISQHYMEDITISSTATEIGYSSSRFMAIFKEYLGTTFTKYLSEIRIQNAKNMLINTDDKITDIANNCGIYNLSYFNRLFKEKHNITPSELRKKYATK